MERAGDIHEVIETFSRNRDASEKNKMKMLQMKK